MNLENHFYNNIGNNCKYNAANHREPADKVDSVWCGRCRAAATRSPKPYP